MTTAPTRPDTRAALAATLPELAVATAGSRA